MIFGIIVFAIIITVILYFFLFVTRFVPPLQRFVYRGLWYKNQWSEFPKVELLKDLILSAFLSIPSVVLISKLGFHTTSWNSVFVVLAVIIAYFGACNLLAKFFTGAFNFSMPGQKINQDKLEGFTLQTVNKGFVQIANPSRGIFVCGGAGSGKTASIINPILEQAGRKNYTGLVYDFKFPNLANQVKDSWKASPVQQYFVNFTDLQKSHRVNPIAPEYIKTPNHAREAAKTLITNLDFKAAQKRDYWVQSSEALLSASIWYFRKRHPQYCHLPAVISFLLNPDTKKTLTSLNSDIEVSNMASSVLSSADNEKQLSGIFSSLQNYLSVLSSPEVFWVLSKAEVNLNLNSSENASILVLGNDPTLSSTFSPLISLIATTALKMMNTQGKEPSLVLLDEAPTLFIPNFAQIPATARENKVATIYGVQDIAQMEALMSPSESEMIISNLGTAFYGRVTNVKTAERVSKLFGKYDQMFTTGSQSNSRRIDEFGGSVSRSESNTIQQRDRLTATDVINFSTGQFAGINAEGNIREFNDVFQYKNTSTEKLEDLTYVTEPQIQSNYLEILELGRSI